jgi:hypothetical protein
MTDRKKKKQKRCLQNAETKRRNFRSNNGHSFRPCFLSLRRIAPRVISLSNLAKNGNKEEVHIPGAGLAAATP